MGEEPPELVRDEAKDARGHVGVRVGRVGAVSTLDWGEDGGAYTLGVMCQRWRGMRESAGTHPWGCWRGDTRSSTAVVDAITASPGRVTVHIWSSIRPEGDDQEKT